MNFPVYTVKDLSDFFSREEDEFEPKKALEFMSQASFLLELATCLDEPPTDPKLLKLWKYAVLDMAMMLYVGSDFLTQKWSPFSSETIGSYSYSIALTKIRDGDATGSSWFDRAVATLGQCSILGTSDVASSGGIEVFEWDGTFVDGHMPGNSRLLSPNDIGSYPPFNLDGRRR